MIETSLPPVGNAADAIFGRASKPAARARQWELVEFAGLGSLAHVYRARPAGAPDDRPATYAVKMLRPCWQDDDGAIRLLQREALVGRTVSHAHLVPILAAHVVDPPRLLVMPWLEGASLGARLADGQQFGVPEALWIARQTAEALDALHEAGWTHGDVTPGNLHIASSGHVTLLDLSFAQRADEITAVVDRPIMGTCSYLAPEHLVSALRPDIRSDIYSLGVVLYEIFTGRRPYCSETLIELVNEQRQTSPAELSRLAPHVPGDVVQLVRRMMANEPLRRPQTPRELRDQLIALEIGAFSQRAG